MELWEELEVHVRKALHQGGLRNDCSCYDLALAAVGPRVVGTHTFHVEIRVFGYDGERGVRRVAHDGAAHGLHVRHILSNEDRSGFVMDLEEFITDAEQCCYPRLKFAWFECHRRVVSWTGLE